MMDMRRLFKTERKALQYLEKGGNADWYGIYGASGSKGSVYNFMDNLVENGLVELTDEHRALGHDFKNYRITRKGKATLKQAS